MKRGLKELFNKNKTLVIIILVSLAILLIFFGTQIILYFNLILGNDTYIKLKSDAQSFNLLRNEETDVKFEASITTNPFCKAQCQYTFDYISNNKTLDKNEFIIRPGSSIEKEYVLKANKLGKGQDLYRFGMECYSLDNFFCHTKGEVTTRSILVTVNYDLNEADKKLKRDILVLFGNLTQNLSLLEGYSINYGNVLNEFSKQVLLLQLNQEFSQLERNVEKNKKQAIEIEKVWNTQDYYLTYQEVSIFNDNILSNEIGFNTFIVELTNNVTLYNGLVYGLINDYAKLENLSKLNITDSDTSLELNRTIKDFNNALRKFSDVSGLNKKQEIVDSITHDINSIYPITTIYPMLESNTNYFNIDNVSFSPISLGAIKPMDIGIKLEEPKTSCCVFNQCHECCYVDYCKNGSENYPVLFLHGHAISQSTSAEYSLEGFNGIQKKLEGESYLNAGILTLYTPEDNKGEWGASNVPITVRGSYYFDVLQDPDNPVIIQTKSENIDAYAIRVKGLVDILKYKTGKDKVDLVAFSMGGLVARRYIQLFGSDDVNKLILIGTPNHGIYGDIRVACSIVGGKSECEDMYYDSIFMSKLNSEPLPDIPVYTIVATGCKMGSKMGDGIVLEESSILDGATNYVINGTCKSKFEPLHLDMRDPGMYPEVYETLLKILKDKNVKHN